MPEGSLNILQPLNSCFLACFLTGHVHILFLIAPPFSLTQDSPTGFQNKSTCFTIKAISWNDVLQTTVTNIECVYCDFSYQDVYVYTPRK